MKAGTLNKVEALMESFPIAAKDDRLLLLMYWKVYDDIDIPADVIKSIIQKGAMPETITRSKRKIAIKD
jgi:hypothetical protein